MMQRVKMPALAVLGLLLGLLLGGCGAPAVAEAPVAAATGSVAERLGALSPAQPTVARVTVVPTLPPARVLISVPTATPRPLFALPAADALTATAAVPPPAVPTAVPTASPTPPPTFTPPALPGTASDEHYWFIRPVPDGGVTWTDKIYPYGGTRGGMLRPHHGVEFQVPFGTPIFAAGAGTVVVAGLDDATAYGPETNFYGGLIVIEHESRLDSRPVYTLYGHLSEIMVLVGQRVAMADVIGRSGASGVADGPHLHFEVRVGSNQYSATRNPALWLYPFRDQGTVAGRVTFPDGAPVENVTVTLHRVDAPSAYRGTATYSGNTVNRDDRLGENFVLDDVPAGYYEVIVNTGDRRNKAATWVYAGRTAFVEIVINP